MSQTSAIPTTERPTTSDVATSAALLEKNLASLGPRNGDLVGLMHDTETPADLAFADSDQSVPSATLDGTPLCSRRRPLDEAVQLVESLDILEHATFIIYGFGLGYHVEELAKRLGRTGLIIVVEPDVALLRGVLETIDHSHWMKDSLLLFITDPNSRAELARKLEGAESTVSLGVDFVEHPPSRRRLADAIKTFGPLFSQYVETARATMMTTLIRSVDTVRNLLLNIDHYAGGDGIADLRNVCQDRPAVIVSAGPSLQRTITALAEPGMRDRCVIIAVQTTLKPLLAAGIKPHFVTALDYHEISQRFYEGLDPEQLQDVTLIAEAKAHPVILDVYPGPIRCCASNFLDRLLGPLQRDMGTIKAGATVAHLALYVADWLGCNPIALIGQDLGFSDGLYYAPGTAIHDVWAPELNPFNTIAMMEWQRIVRHRVHLRKLQDVHGRPIYTDTQMLTYLRQFEADFAEMVARGKRIVDAGGGGVAKQHTDSLPLDAFLARHAHHALPSIPLPVQNRAEHLAKVSQRVGCVREDIKSLHDAAEKASELLDCMLRDQHEPRKMEHHFRAMDAQRRIVDERSQAFELVNTVNQLGTFKRLRADRRMQLSHDLPALERQRLEMLRDRENVKWIADAAEEMLSQFDAATRVLAGETTDARGSSVQQIVKRAREEHGEHITDEASRIAAVLAIDPSRHAVDDESFRHDLRQTVLRLMHSEHLCEIIVIAHRDAAMNWLQHEIAAQVPSESTPTLVIEAANPSPFTPEHEAIRKARLFSDVCWRGGIGGLSIYDELLCPQTMHEILTRRELTAALLVGPDWPAVQVEGSHGCDAVIQRHMEFPQRHQLVFTQAVPGLCGCIVGRDLMKTLSDRHRLATIGSMLVYQPSTPQHDPIARDANVQLPPELCRPIARLTTAGTRQQQRWQTIMKQVRSVDNNAAALLDAYRNSMCSEPDVLPQHIILELTTRRTSHGVFARHPYRTTTRADMPFQMVEQLCHELAAAGELASDVVLTLDGLGDPLLHEHCDRVVQTAVRNGFAAIHVRTELLTDRSTIDRLLDAGVDVFSIDLHADRAATYRTMMGVDRFGDVLANIEYLLDQRRLLTPQIGTHAIGLPWIVPRMQRCMETFEDIDTFYDRWQHTLGAVVLEQPAEYVVDLADDLMMEGDSLTPAPAPRQVIVDQLQRRMLVLSDGTVPIDERDLGGLNCVGRIGTQSVRSIWIALQDARRAQLDTLGLFRS